MHKQGKAYCTVLLVLLTMSIVAQQRGMNLTMFEQRHGIPDVRITCIAKDALGLLWLGTEEGIYQFDGHHCRRLTVEDPALYHANVTSLLFTSDQSMWIGTFSDGLFQYHVKYDSLRHFAPGPGSLPSNRVKYIQEDRHGQLWIASHISGLNLLDTSQFGMTNYRPSSVIEGEETRDLDEFTVIEIDPADSHTLWIGSLAGLLKFNTLTKEFALHRLEKQLLAGHDQFNGYENKIRDVHHDGSNVWFSSFGGGLSVFHPASGSYDTYKFESFDPPSTGLNNIKHIVPWPDGNLQCIPYNHGILQFDPASKVFRATQLPEMYTSFAEDNGKVWYADRTSLYLYHPAAQSAQKVRLEQNIGYVFPRPASNKVYAVFWDNTIMEIDEANGRMTPIIFTPEGPPAFNAIKSINFSIKPDPVIVASNALYSLDMNRRVASLLMPLDLGDEGILSTTWASNHEVWLGSKTGLFRLDISTGKQTLYSTRDGLVHDVWINDLHYDRHGNLWYATELGFGALDREHNPIHHFPYRPERATDPTGPLKHIANVISDSKDRIWVADHDQGVAVFEQSADGYALSRRINRIQGGLASNRVLEMALDHHGDAWLVTPKGLSKISTADFRVENYGAEYGLGHLYHISMSDEGYLYIGGVDGYHRVDPAELRPAEERTTVLIQSLSIYDEPYRDKIRPPYLGDIELSHRDGFFTIGFTALDYLNAAPVEYQYRMEGLQEDWVSNGERQYVGFTKLSGGTYTFMVRARSGNRPWSEAKALNIRIVPAFWQTSWFHGLIGVLLAAAILSLYRYRMAQVRREEQYKASFDKKLAETEMAALRAQMNPHFLFNCLNSIKLFTIENDTARASKFLTKFSRLIRLILQNSQSATVKLADELEALQLYIEMEAMRFEDKFSYIINRNGVEVDKLVIPPLVLQPYVENAIWHGLMHKDGNGHLQIDIRQKDNQLICVVEDNGIGIAASCNLPKSSTERKKSYGMSITRDRLSLIRKLYDVNAEVMVEDLVDNGRAGGTRVTVRIPAMYDN